MNGTSSPPGDWMLVLLCGTSLFIAFALARAEWRRFQDPRPEERHFATTGRLARRLTGSILIGILTVMLVTGTLALDFEGRPGLFSVYWGAFALLLLVLVAIATADLLDTHRIVHLHQSRALRDVLQQAANLQEAQTRKSSPRGSGPARAS